MKIFKTFGILLLVCLMLSLTACTDQTQTDDSGTTTGETETETKAESVPGGATDSVQTIKIAGGGVAANVVIPTAAESTLIDFGKSVATRITKQTGIEPTVKDDYLKADESYDSQTVEILIGLTEYPETKQVLSELKYGTAIVKVVGNKVVVLGTDEESQKKAVNSLLAYFINNTTEKQLFLPAEYSKIEVLNELAVELPMFSEISLSKTSLLAISGPAYEAVYHNVTQAEYESYEQIVLNNGFQKYTQNTIDQNVFTTYKNENHVLTVMWTPATQEIRSVVEALSTTALPATEANTSYTPTHDTTLMQVGLLYKEGQGVGMSYVMQLDDGSFILIDGGYAGDLAAERLYNIMKHKAPDPNNIVIAAWIASHDHNDHIDVIPYFLKNYSDKVSIEMFITNFPVKSQYTDASPNYTSFVTAISTYCPQTPNVSARPGQVFYIRNAKVTMLYTPDLYMPDTIKWSNSSSLIFSIEAEGTKFMCLGDTTNFSAAVATEIYSAETFQSDIIQVAHHGVNDFPPEALYPLIDPEYVLWPMGRGPLSEGTDGWKNFLTADSTDAACNKWFWESDKCNQNVYYADDDVDVLLLKDGEVVSVTVYDNCDAFIADTPLPEGNPWLED